LVKSISSSQGKQKADLIFCTAKLLLAQVKMLLDKSLMENG